MTKKNANKLAARQRQAKLGGKYQRHLRRTGGATGNAPGGRGGITLKVTNARDMTSFERTFRALPVLIGRHPFNDLQLDLPYVADFHVALEWDGDALVLRDLGSRHGTLLRATGRVPPNGVVDLASARFEFAIVTHVFEARLSPTRGSRSSTAPATR